MSKTSRYSCTQNKGKAFDTYSSALAERNRLNKSSSSSSTASSSGSGTYCHDSSDNLFYKSGGSRCSGSDKKISKREYSNRRLDSSSTTTTTSSSSKIWCATKSDYFAGSSSACLNKGGTSYAYNGAGLQRARTEHYRLKRAASTSTNIWCATKRSVSLISRSSCVLVEGKAFSSYAAATSERARLKSASSSSSLKTGFIIAAVIAVLVFLRRLGKRSSQRPRTKTTGVPAPARKVVQPQPKVTPPARPTVEAPSQEDAREQLVGIDPSWSIDRKLKYVREKFVECNDRIAILSEGSEKDRLQEMLNACGELRRKYGA